MLRLSHSTPARFSYFLFLLRLLAQPINSFFSCSLLRVSPIARRILCSACLNLHHSSVCGVSSGLLIKSEQLTTAFILHLVALRPCSSLFPTILCWCGRGARLCLLVCLLYRSVCCLLLGTSEQMACYVSPCRVNVLQSAASCEMTAETTSTVNLLYFMFYQHR